MVHPEGQLYFYDSAHRTVTDEFLHAEITLSRVNFWIDKISNYAAQQNVDLPISSELYLELDEDTVSCKYYFVDHTNRGVFWLDIGNTLFLGLPEMSSDDHKSNCTRIILIVPNKEYNRNQDGRAILDTRPVFS